jgi:hypothetical protein
VWTKRVERLRDGAEYRSSVRFRWYASRGRLQSETRRTTPVCRQPDRRADLAVESLAISPVVRRPVGPLRDHGRQHRADGGGPVRRRPVLGERRGALGARPGGRQRTTVELDGEPCTGTQR